MRRAVTLEVYDVTLPGMAEVGPGLIPGDLLAAARLLACDHLQSAASIQVLDGKAHGEAAGADAAAPEVGIHGHAEHLSTIPSRHDY